jgi:hypothetical protein
MRAAFVSDEGDCDENKHHDQDDALFIFGELENSEKALHRSVAQLSLLNGGTPPSSSGFLHVVILSEAKNLSYFFIQVHRANGQRCFASLNMTRTAYFA